MSSFWTWKAGGPDKARKLMLPVGVKTVCAQNQARPTLKASALLPPARPHRRLPHRKNVIHLGRSLWLSAGARGQEWRRFQASRGAAPGGCLPAGVHRPMTVGSGEVRDLAPNSPESHGEKAAPLSITHQS